MTRLPFIVNPAAGGGRAATHVDAAVARLRQGGLEVDVHLTRGPGHASELAQQAWAAGYRTLLCGGGDGTTYEVVNGLYPLTGDELPTLGTIPLGTGNSFLRDFGILTAEQALRAVIANAPRAVDVIRVEHDEGVLHYVNLLSVGFTSDVGMTTNRWFKPLGAAGYAVATVLEVARLSARPFPHALDDGPIDTTPYCFVSFSNSRCTGGDMQMAPHADVADGQVDVIRVGDLGRVGLLRAFPRIYQGTHLQVPKNSGALARHVRFELREALPVMIDGEVETLRLRSLTVLPGALRILA